MSIKGRYSLVLFLMVCVLLVVAGCQRPAPEPDNTGSIDYPTKPITFVCGSGVGGGTDTMMRGIMPYFEKYINARVIGENRQGAHGLIAANYCYQAEPDGYTVFIANNPYAMQIIMNKDKNDTGLTSLLDFIPVASWLNADGNAFVVTNDSLYQTIDDLAQAAKERTLSIGTAGGVLSSDHITFLMFQNTYGGNYNFVPFDSGAEAITALLGNHIDAAVVSLSGEAVNPGQIRILATTLDERIPQYPDVPTFAELGYPELSLSFHVGALVPPGTPEEVVDKMEEAFRQAFYDPEFQAWAESSGKPIGNFYDREKWTNFLIQYEAGLMEIMPMLEEAAKAQ